MMRLILFLIPLVYAQNNPPWPLGSSGQQQPNANSGGFNPQQQGPGQASWNPNQPLGPQFGNPAPNNQQPNPIFASANNPTFGAGQPQHTNALQPVNGVPLNNPPPGSSSVADRALQPGASNPQFGNQPWNPNQPIGQPIGGQPIGQQPVGAPFGQSQPGQPNWQQPGQPNWANPNTDPRFGQQPGNPGSFNPNNPQNPNNPNNNNPWQQQSTPTPYPQRPNYYVGSSAQLGPLSLITLVAFALLHAFM